MLAACGGGGDKEDATTLLDRAFDHSIRSADVKIDGRLETKGLKGLDKPVRVEASGPYKDNGRKFPSFDIDLKVGAGEGQTISTGRVSTGDRAFVKFEDTYYELPRSQVAAANRSFRGDERKKGLVEGLGVDARSWVGDAKVEGGDKVGGVDTTHVSGTLDVPRALRDVNRFVQRSGTALGAASGGQVPKALSRSDLDKIAEVVKDPTFDVYVGKDDDTIRRLSARMQFQVPKEDRASVNGLQGGSVEFSIEFDDVNGDQKIEAPAKARPLSDLTKSLGASALDGGLSGLGSGGTGTGTDTTPANPPSSGSGGTSTGPTAEDFKNYANCLDKAKAQDTEALQRCATLLQP
jgi:hypothetical protein